MRHLDDRHWDLESTTVPQFLFDHLLSTIEALGGFPGLCVLVVGLLLFYLYVLRSISSRHKKAKKVRKSNKGD